MVGVGMAHVTFVGAFTELFVVAGLLEEIQDLTGHFRIREGESFGLLRRPNKKRNELVTRLEWHGNR